MKDILPPIEAPRRPSGTVTAARKLPAEGTALAKVLYDTAFRNAFHARLKSANRYVVALYRMGILPLFGLSRRIMLLVTRGRTSGKQRYFPVGYFRIGKDIVLFSAWGTRSNWFKNLVAAPDDVCLRIGLRRFPVRAHVLADAGEIRILLAQFVAQSPAQAKGLLGWEAGRDRIETADFTPIVENVLVVRFAEK
jgi:deazaflavin-dependent oxidoreductase (nitroreductase family)